MDAESKLKSVSVEKLQAVISKAISALLGEEYDCAIDAIEYTAVPAKGAKLSVSVHQHLDDRKTLPAR